MTISEWLKGAKEKVDSLDAELILCAALDFEDRVDLVIKSEEEFDFQKAEEMLSQRLKGLPLAYITGYKEFYGRKFKVTKNVLIPRPETEQAIISALSIIDVEGFNNVRILDIGTGSGCIAITLKLELNAEKKRSEIFGTDVSKPALEIAKTNAKNLNADVMFFEADLLEKNDSLPDIIIANLPYVNPKWDWISSELKFEPALALFTDDNGLKLIKKLIDQIIKKPHNDNSKFLILEADTSQHEDIIEYARKNNFNLISRSDFILSFKY